MGARAQGAEGARRERYVARRETSVWCGWRVTCALYTMCKEKTEIACRAAAGVKIHTFVAPVRSEERAANTQRSGSAAKALVSGPPSPPPPRRPARKQTGPEGVRRHQQTDSAPTGYPRTHEAASRGAAAGARRKNMQPARAVRGLSRKIVCVRPPFRPSRGRRDTPRGSSLACRKGPAPASPAPPACAAAWR